MNTEKFQQVRRVWHDLYPHLARQTTEYDIKEISNRLASIFSPGPFYYYVFDFSCYQFTYVSESRKTLLGLEPEQNLINHFLDAIHPQDLDFFKDCEKFVGRFLFEYLQPNQILHYKFSYCFRLRTFDDSYRLFLHQSMGVSLDEFNRLGKVFGIHTDISHITTTNNGNISILGINGMPSYENIDVRSGSELLTLPSKPLFTAREIEVIKLLADGASNREIADNLFISIGTVKKHRENILRKSDAQNTPHLVAMAIRNGLI